jgi:1A family penicillin-binding protein
MRFSFFKKRTALEKLVLAGEKVIKAHPIRSFFIGFLLVCGALFFIGTGAFLLWSSTLSIPTIQAIQEKQKESSTKIYDRTGQVLLYDTYQDVRRIEIPLSEMSPHIQEATIAIEDARFYHHFGVDPIAIFRSLIRNIESGDVLGGQGGSTITQQVVKNTLLVRDKTISRKLKEWMLALKLEREMSKDKILELYLNEVPYGGTHYGVEEASQSFFGKSAKDLTIAESAYLASLPQAPTYYSPYGNNRSALDARKDKVLERMNALGFITNDEYAQAKKEKVAFQHNTSTLIKAPHFVFFVLEYLAEKYGDRDLAQLGLSVTTTLDWDLQKEGERIVYEQAHKNASTYNASNASLMAVDPKTGEILTMVGSRDYFDESVDGNYNIGLANRQPGSSFKPFAYAAAIQKGYTTETVVYDVPTQFSTSCAVGNFTSDDGCYSPKNYDDTFRGPMTFRDALAQSVNIPAVKVLYLAGMKNTIGLAEKMGLTTLGDYKRYGLTLVLGGGEVSLLEMTGAYGVFANDGTRFPEISVLEVKDKSGNTLEKAEPKGKEVLEPEVARSISDMLSDNVARTPAFGASSYLNIPDRDVAVKTGTTNDYHDAWIIGYTPDIAVGAWAGNNDNSPMEKKVAGFIVAPLWNEFMQTYFKKYPDKHDFTPPPPIPEDIPAILRGVKPALGGALEPHDILAYVDKDNPRKGGSSAGDAQYPYWEYGVLAYTFGAENAPLAQALTTGTTPTPEKIEVDIVRPRKNARVRADDTVSVSVTTEAEKPIQKIAYLVDGNLLEEKTGDEADSFSFMPAERGISSGSHMLMVLAYTESGNRGGATVAFEVR